MRAQHGQESVAVYGTSCLQRAQKVDKSTTAKNSE